MGNKPIRGGIREGYPTTSQLSLNSSFEWDQDTQSAVSSNGSSGSGSDFRSTSDNIDGELMEVPSAFEILFDDLIALEFIGSGRYAEVYKVLWVPKKGEVELEVAMKKLKTLFNPKEYVRVFKNEISVLGALQQRSSGHPNVINFIGCCTNPYLIVTELLVQSLHNALFKSSTVHTNLRTILKIALDVASGLEYLHQNNIIHRDLSSRNVMLDSDDLAKATAKVSDFGLSKLLEPQKLSNEVVDPRIERATDVYSFALILYQLISKLVQIEDKPSDIADIHLRGSDSSYRPLKSMDKVTFSSDPHQAAIQKMLIELMMDCWDQNPLARPTFTEIVVLLSDLIRKEANPSYVSEFAAIQRKRHNAVFSIPTDKAYGRDIEIATVKDIFKQHERGVKNVTRFILVAGPSGIGKSCFVRKVFADLEEMYFDNKESISFYSGKFDQFQSNSIPYSAIIDAIRQLITNKVVIPGKKNMLVRKKWKRTIKKIIGKNAALIAEVIPEIGAILASKKNKGSASAMDCSPDEAKTRFTQTFLGLLNVLSTPNHKLVLFIDDWQWADDATLNILPEILKNQNLIVIGAYRDNECPEGHPFLNMVSVVKKQANMRVHEIVLGAPSAAELNNICCDALRNHDDKQRTMPLAELIHKRTGGNPFFFAQFLSTLHMNNLIYFDPKSEKWQYDLEKITQQGFSGVIVDFMVSKLRMLSSKSRQILQLASCLGSTFHFSTLRVMCAHVKINDDNGTAKVIGDISVRDLHECIDNNYLQPASAYGGAISLSHNADVAYRFAHDKIQQAAFMLFAAPTSHSDRVLTTAADGSAADKTKDQPQTLEYVRVQIAQVLLDNTDLDQNPAAIFSIVSNFNLGRTILATLPGGPQKLIQLTRLNLRAAEQALKTGDYTSALHHARVAVEVLFDLAPRALFPSFTGNDQELKDRVWQDPEYKLLAIEVTLQAQQLEYYNKNIARGDEQFEIIKKFVTDETALARSFRHKTVQLELEMAYFEGLSVASEYFAKYCGDKDIPKDLRSVTLEQAKEVFYSVKKMAEDQGYIQFKDPEYLARSKAVPEIPIVSMFGAAIVPMMMTASVPGTIYVCSKAIEISLKRNIMKKAAFYACSVLAAIVPHVLGEFDCLCTMLENAYEYSEARYDPNFSFGYLVNARFWKHPIADCVHLLLNETLRISMEQGDGRNAEYAIIFASHLNSYVGPENLPDFFKKFSKYQDYCGSMGFKLAGLYITSSLSNMRVLDASNDSAEDDLLQFETAVIKPLPPYPKMYFYSQKALVYLVLGRSDKRDLYTALCSANNLIACTSPSYSSIAMLALIYFVDCMIRLALFNESEEQEQQEWRSIIEDRIEKLHIYARLHTDNFSHYYYLCLAQRARVLSMEPRGVCVEHYTTAISYARNNNFLWVAGLSAEFLAQYYTEIGDNNAFAQSLQEAYAFYKKWGATRKTSLMLQEYGSSVLKAELAGEEKIDSIDPSAVSELLQASAQGDIEKVLAAIKKLGAGNVNAKDQDKKSTAMHHAAAYGHVNVIRILAAHGANVNELDVLESTPLHYAAANGFPDAVDALCEAFLQNASNGGVTAMKAWLNQRNGYGYSALQVALANTSKSGAITTVTSLSPRRKAQQLAVAERLLSHGADINVKQSNSSTVLHEACVNGDLETVMFLLFQQQTNNNNNSGNDDETSNSSRRRRSSSTANKKQPLKCRSNINISLRDRDNVTALQLAAKKSHSAIVQALVDFINAKFNVITTTDVAFDQAGFSALINSTIMVRGKDGHNMLHTAMARNDRETVTILMNTVSNGNASIHPGARQIWIASIFKMLNTKDVATGSTPLVLGLRAASAATSAPAAIEVAFLPALVSLVTANNSSSSNNNSNNISGELLAFLRTANSKGETPMGIALANGYSTIVTYLVKLGVPRDSPSSVINTAQ